MHRQFGQVLVDRFFEPHYGQGKPERWQIGLESGEPFGIACLWETAHLAQNHANRVVHHAEIDCLLQTVRATPPSSVTITGIRSCVWKIKFQTAHGLFDKKNGMKLKLTSLRVRDNSYLCWFVGR